MSSRAFLVFLCPFFCHVVPVFVSSCSCPCVLLCLSLRQMVHVCVSSWACLLCPVVPVFMCPLAPAIVTSWTCPCALRSQSVCPPLPVFVLWRLSLSPLCFARSSVSIPCSSHLRIGWFRPTMRLCSHIYPDTMTQSFRHYPYSFDQLII
jgi:hypothetical protein